MMSPRATMAYCFDNWTGGERHRTRLAQANNPNKKRRPRAAIKSTSLETAQCPSATRVAGFQTWRTMGRFVRKGEKGIAILAPIVGRRKTEDDSKTVIGFRAAYVFDGLSRDSDRENRPACR